MLPLPDPLASRQTDGCDQKAPRSDGPSARLSHREAACSLPPRRASLPTSPTRAGTIGATTR